MHISPAPAGFLLKIVVVFVITNRFFVKNPEKSNRFFYRKQPFLSFFLYLFILFFV